MKSLFRLKEFINPYHKQILGNILLLLGITVLSLIIPDIIRRVIDIGLSRGEVEFLIQSALLILGIGVITAVMNFGQRYLSEYVAAKIGYDLRNRLYDHIQHLSFSYHDHTQTGQLISRCIEDVRAIERFTGFGVVELIRISLLLIGIIALLLFVNLRLSAIALLPMIPLVLITTDLGKRIGGLFLAVDNILGELSARLQENVTGVQVVRAFAREDHEIERFDNNNRTLYDARLTVITEWSKIMPTTHLLVTLGTILVIWIGGRMVLDGQMTVGEVVAFNSYLLMLASPTQQLAWLVNLAGEASAGVQRVYQVLDTQPEIQSPPEALQVQKLSGKVEFKQVCFRYQGERNAALEDINLTVEPNQIVALIGPTGSGKTSLVNLISRFYDVTQGELLIDGIDVRKYDLVSLRRQIGIVLQTSLLFSATVRENLVFGRPHATEEEVIAATKTAQAHEFILKLPQGYDTVVGERGVTLSGGQRQRVAIARALLMDPRILILDDSTSSVDTQTELLIQQALQELMQDRTTFVIAHRLSTVRRADMILVMDQARVIERGTHHELLKLGGLYREIYDLQLRDQDALEEITETIITTPTVSVTQRPYQIEEEGNS